MEIEEPSSVASPLAQDRADSRCTVVERNVLKKNQMPFAEDISKQHIGAFLCSFFFFLMMPLRVEIVHLLGSRQFACALGRREAVS